MKEKKTYKKPVVKVHGDIKKFTLTKETLGNFDAQWDEAS